MKILGLKSNLQLIALIFFISFVISCTETEFKIELPVPTQKFVVHSTLTPFTPPVVKSFSVFVSQNTKIFDSLVVAPVTDATVKLFVNGQFSQELKYNSLIGYWTDFFPESGKEYKITIEKAGFETASAMGTIPPNVKIKSSKLTPIAGIGEDNLTLSGISVTFDDPADQVNYYEIMVWRDEQENDKYRLFTNDRIITSESYYPSPILIESKQPERLLFNDEQINGKTHTIELMYYAPQYLSHNQLYIYPHIDFLLFRSVSKDYYLYYTTLFKQINNRRPDLLFGIAEPSPVYTNIQNGFGVFAGYSEDNRIFEVDSLKVR